jgi:predicted dehydrogenase (TIGR03970 family)
MRRQEFLLHRDVLIVGAGSAGSVVAERLSANPDCHVTVVEAGPAVSDPWIRTSVMGSRGLPIGAGSDVVQRYTTTLTDHPSRTAQIVRGAVIGGSGAVNGGYFCRGLPDDFDRWALPGWAWADVLDHFRAIENDFDFRGPLHGSDGPIPVRRTVEFDGATAAFLRSAADNGFDWLADLNGASAGPAPVGSGPVPLNIDGGIRVGPGEAYLRPAMNRGNLTVLSGTRVARVLIAADRAVAVECAGQRGVLAADRIVLCAGAIGSAQLLMLSGIGPEEVLRPLGIPVLCASPVGKRSADHSELVLPVDWPAAPGRPALEALLVSGDSIEIRPYTVGFNTMTGDIAGNASDQRHLGIALMRPESRGRVTLVSTDPLVSPVISHRYDAVASDLAALQRGTELACELAMTTAEPKWSTSQHLCGTAPMGMDGDETAVLDIRCRVRGIEGLWVVDGSVLPSITSRGPHATIVMIGHRAAEFIGG